MTTSMLQLLALLSARWVTELRGRGGGGEGEERGGGGVIYDAYIAC